MTLEYDVFKRRIKNTKFRIIDILGKEERPGNKTEEEHMGPEPMGVHFSFMLYSLSIC